MTNILEVMNITIIHKGKLLATGEKDTFLYKYGIIRCGQEAFDALRSSHSKEVLRYATRDNLFRVLVEDQEKLPTLNDSYVLENPILVIYQYYNQICLPM